MKKLICGILCLALTFSLFGCKKPEENPDTTTTEEIQQTTAAKTERKVTLGYYEGKSFNPFTTLSPTNKNITTLVYDSLFLFTADYDVEPLIGLSYSNSEKMLTVSLDPEAQFCDGSLIEPDDVVYSFGLAKESPHYKQRLENFVSAAEGVSSVTFSLSAPDVYAQNCLTFPIVKSSTGDKDIPTGSGRYSLIKKQNKYSLTANEYSTRREEMATERISLIPITSDSGELYMLQTGDLTYFFDDLSDGEYTKIGANTIRVPLNNMVFMGINSENKIFNKPELREAICLSVNKASLADSAYSGIAAATDIPFNPQWQALKDTDSILYQQSLMKSGELLEECGYVYAYSGNEYRSKNFEYLEMKLIVNNESKPKVTIAENIARCLRDAGIKVTLNKISYEEYISALNSSAYDLYIGEIKLSPNMSLSPFFSPDGSASYGIDDDCSCIKAYSDFVSGKIDITTFINVFDSEKPFIPLLFREGMAYYSRELTYEDTVNEYELFANIYSWSVTS